MNNRDNNYFKTIKIGDHIAELPKSLIPASAAVDNGKYPFFCSSSEPKASNICLEKHSAIIMGTGGIASVNLGKNNFAYSTDTWAFRSKNPDLKTAFLYRKIQQLIKEIDYAAFEGSGLKHLRKDYVRDLKLKIPNDKNISDAIIQILDNLDTSIEKTETLIEKYQQIKAGLMHDLFTRGVTEDGKLRPPRDQAPELYQETPIGWIPKDWTLTPFESIAHFQRGYDIVEKEFSGHKYPVVSSGGIIGYHDIYTTKGPAIVIGRKGTIGKVHFLRNNFWAHDTSLFSTSLFGNEPLFVYYLCTWLDLGRFGTRSGSPSLNRNDFHSLPVGKPSTTEQTRIISSIESCERKLDRFYKNKSKLKKQKSGLMHDLLTGKVSVEPLLKTTTEGTAHV